MPIVQVEVEIPDGYELACKPINIDPVKFKDKKHTDYRLLLRPAWQWPAWLKSRWIAMDDDVGWYAFSSRPHMLNNGWGGKCEFLDSRLFDFTPPPCDDWTKSLRENPNWREENA